MSVYVGITLWLALYGFLHTGLVNKYSEPEGGTAVLESVIRILLTMGVIVFFIGLRSAGSDTHSYISTFNSSPYGFDQLFNLENYDIEGENLFQFLTILCKTLVNNYHFYLLTIAAISGFCVAIGLRRYSSYYDMLIVLFMLDGYYTWMFNGIRQFLALSIIFVFAHCIYEKKYVPYIVAVLVAYEIHNSAILMLPVIFLVQGEAWDKKTLELLGCAILAVMFSGQFLDFMDSATEGTAYEGVRSNFSGGSSIIHTLIYAVPLVMAFIKRDMIKEQKDTKLNTFVNLSIICASASLVANFTSGIYYGRIPVYFSLYSLMLLVWLANNAFPKFKLPILIGMFGCYTYLFLMDGGYYYYSDILFGGKIVPAW